MKSFESPSGEEGKEEGVICQARGKQKVSASGWRGGVGGKRDPVLTSEGLLLSPVIAFADALKNCRGTASPSGPRVRSKQAGIIFESSEHFPSLIRLLPASLVYAGAGLLSFRSLSPSVPGHAERKHQKAGVGEGLEMLGCIVSGTQKRGNFSFPN